MKQKHTLIFGIVIALFSLGGVIILTLFLNRQVFLPAPSTLQKVPIYGFDGKVLSIQETFLVVKPTESSLVKQDEIKVVFDKATEFKKVILFVHRTTTSEPVIERKEEQILPSEIKIGDEILVITHENINDKKEILAKEIRLSPLVVTSETP